MRLTDTVSHTDGGMHLALFFLKITLCPGWTEGRPKQTDRWIIQSVFTMKKSEKLDRNKEIMSCPGGMFQAVKNIITIRTK